MPNTKPTTAKLIGAFAAVYFIWGSTYLAIRYAIETMPPFLMASSRFLFSGTVLYAWSRMNGSRRGTRKGWRHAVVLGALLMLGGNGSVVFAEQWVPSGVAAVIVATVTLWMALFGWLRPGGKRPSAQVAFGIVLGLFGVAMLVGVGRPGGSSVHTLGALILVLSTISWAAGSLYSQKVHISDSTLQSSGMQMVCGGTWLLVAGLVAGEWTRFKLEAVSVHSILAFFYLAIFGSIVGFTAYSWLLKNTTPARSATYAYVNPGVAVLLGWAIAGEPLTGRVVFSMAVIVASVMVITLARQETAHV